MSGEHDEKDATPEETDAEWWQRRFRQDADASRRAWDAGNFPALIEIVAICLVDNQPLPPWVSRAVLVTLLESYEKAPARGRGRTANVKSSFIQNWKHFLRWEAVNTLLERPEKLKSMGRRHSKAASYEVASNELVGTIAQGTARTMKASYDIVQAAVREGKVDRYRIPRIPLLEIALEAESQKPDRKSR